MSSTPQTEVALMGMRFHVCVGILPHEREIAQPLEVDLVVRCDATADAVIDYRELYDVVQQTVTSEPLTYLEPFAEALASRVLAFEGVNWCRVAVRKPQVPLGGPLAFAQVAVERSHV